jgi:predicted permease
VKFCGLIPLYIILVLWGIVGFVLGLFILTESDPNNNKDVCLLLLLLTIFGIPLIIFLTLNQFVIENLFD